MYVDNVIFLFVAMVLLYPGGMCTVDLWGAFIFFKELIHLSIGAIVLF